MFKTLTSPTSSVVPVNTPAINAIIKKQCVKKPLNENMKMAAQNVTVGVVSQ